jgi:hypothetical protein
MDDELLHALGRIRRDELANASSRSVPMHDAVPLTASERQRVLAAVFERLDGTPPLPETAAPIELRRWRSGVLIAGALATAAALVLMLARPTAPVGGPTPLPEYSFTRIGGSSSEVRSEPSTQVVRLADPGEPIDWVITPRSRVRDELAVTIVARPEQGAPRLADVTTRAERSPDGAVRLRGPLRELIALAAGRWTIEVIISPAGAAPRTVAELDDGSDHAWRGDTVEVMIDAE